MSNRRFYNRVFQRNYDPCLRRNRTAAWQELIFNIRGKSEENWLESVANDNPRKLDQQKSNTYVRNLHVCHLLFHFKV